MEDLLLELLLCVFVLEVKKEMRKLRLRLHHKGGEQDVPIIEKNFAVVLQEISKSQVGVLLYFLVRVGIAIVLQNCAFMHFVVFGAKVGRDDIRHVVHDGAVRYLALFVGQVLVLDHDLALGA